MSCPTDELMAAAHRVLMYLFHHRTIGLRFSKAQLPVSGFSDSDWATKHSTSGYVSSTIRPPFHGRPKSSPL
eukprot:356947-Pleurochrysis_carterae.AAC.1